MVVNNSLVLCTHTLTVTRYYSFSGVKGLKRQLRLRVNEEGKYIPQHFYDVH